MIEYPRIFSLSTVGVRKHYNQDYLLHQVRTDFTGNNGIGKSLIADLFQLIFIGQKSKISFGTESFKNKDRHIHTIPYNTDDAYVFIHIEFKKNEFITIGTNIGNKRSRPLKSFWILNQAYNDNDRKDLETLALHADQLAYSKDFLKFISLKTFCLNFNSKSITVRLKLSATIAVKNHTKDKTKSIL